MAAGRAPLGGPREALLAALIGARLAAGALAGQPLAAAQRAARADAARAWLSSVAVGPVIRVAAQRLFEATARADAAGVAAALTKVTEVTAPHLDSAARSELVSLIDRLGR
jgi:hypothetical protein